MNRKRRKNRRLKAITWTATVGLLLSACCMDSKSYIPMVTCGVCGLYLFLFALANGE